MKEKLLALLDRIPFLKKIRWLRLKNFFKKTFGTFGLFFLISIVGCFAWFYFHPLSEYSDYVKAKGISLLSAKEFRFSGLKWNLSFSRLSLGIKANEVVIEGSPFAKRFFAPQLVVDVEPFKLLLGKIPLRVTSENGEWSLSAIDPTSPNEVTSSYSEKLLRNLRIKVDLKKFLIQIDPKRFSLNDSQSLIKASDADFDMNVVGLPGHFNAELSAEMDLIVSGSKFRSKGPIKLTSDGYTQVNQGKVVGVNFESISTDLSNLYISAFEGTVEKAPGMNLKLRSEAQAIVNDQGRVSLFELKQGTLLLDELKLGFSSVYSLAQQSLALRWIHDPQEVQAFRFPLRGLSHIPVKGMVELQGNIKTSRDQDFEAGWKISFNNLKIDPTQVPTVFDATSKGTFLLSFVSEGTYSKGFISTPRTELQVDGETASLEFLDSKFVKPVGGPINLLLKAVVENDELDISHFSANLNNMNLQGQVKLSNFTEYLKAEKPSYLTLNFQSNPVNLTRWSSYIPLFRRIPLEGLIQIAGTAEGPLYPTENSWRDVAWRIDRMAASKVKGAFDKDSFIQMGYRPEDFSLSGPFSLEFLFQGRGKGEIVDRGTLIAQADFGRVFMSRGNSFRKSADVPASFDIGFDQSSNRLAIRRGSLKLHEMVLNFEGNILNGSKRNWIDVRLEKPLHLEDWRKLFPNLGQDIPLAGDVMLNGKVGFDNQEVFEGTLNWRKVSADGTLDLKNISTKIGKLMHPILKGNGRVVVGGNSLTVPTFQFKLGSSQMNLSLNGTTLSQKSPLSAGRLAMAQGNLGWLFGSQPWNLSAVLTMDQYDPMAFSFEKNKKDAVSTARELDEELEAFVKNLATSKKWSESQLKLVATAKESKQTPWASRGLSMVGKWDKKILRLDPLVLNGFGGKVTGAFSYDMNPYVLGKENPLGSFSGKIASVQVDDLIDFIENRDDVPLRGIVDAQLSLSFEGFHGSDFKNSAQGRVTGNIVGGEFEGFSELRQQLRQFFQESKARDYLLKNSNWEKCLGRDFSARFDLSFTQGKVKIADTLLKFPQNSTLGLAGEVEKDLKARLSGDFFSGPECVKGNARVCLAEGQDFVAFPFALTGALSNPTLTTQIEERIPRFVECMVNRITKQSQSATQSRVKRIEDEQEREKIRNALKGSSQ